MIKIGSSDVKLKLGDQDVVKSYLGSEEAYDPTPPDNYGVLKFYRDIDTVASVGHMVMGCEVTLVDSDKFVAWYNVNKKTEFTYEGGQWSAGWGEIPIADFNELGLSVTATSSWAEFSMEVSKQPSPTSPIIELPITTETDYNALGGNNSSLPLSISTYGDIERVAVIGYSFGSLATTTPNYFLYFCGKISEMDFTNAANLASIGNYFLVYTMQSNNPQTFDITLPDSVTSIGDNFLQYNNGYNGKVTANGVERIGSWFMSACQTFNQPLSFPKLVSIGGAFLVNAGMFNGTLYLPNVEVVGSRFLYSLSKFNQPIDLPKLEELNCTQNESEEYFIANLSSFNSTINVPKLKKVTLSAKATRVNLFGSLQSFTGKITIPSTFTENTGKVQLCNASKKAYTLEVNCSVIPGTSLDSLFANRVCSASGSSDQAYTTGITIIGAYASSFMSRYPNRSSSPFRKLIAG